METTLQEIIVAALGALFIAILVIIGGVCSGISLSQFAIWLSDKILDELERDELERRDKR